MNAYRNENKTIILDYHIQLTVTPIETIQILLKLYTPILILYDTQNDVNNKSNLNFEHGASSFEFILGCC